MDRNKKYFLNFLMGRGTKNVLFEPFITKAHTETLIWRRGEHLWSTPGSYLDTLLSLSERTYSDMVFADLRLFGSDKARFLNCAAEMREKISPLGVGIICRGEDAEAVVKSGAADVIAVYGVYGRVSLPVIRMDGDISQATERGECAWYAPDSAEKYLEEYGDRIRILGGLGDRQCERSTPNEIYSRVEKIGKSFGSKWACGSGGTISDGNYLELISLLGAFRRIRV